MRFLPSLAPGEHRKQNRRLSWARNRRKTTVRKNLEKRKRNRGRVGLGIGIGKGKGSLIRRRLGKRMNTFRKLMICGDCMCEQSFWDRRSVVFVVVGGGLWWRLC